MSENEQMQMDVNDLYREEVVTDRRVGTIRLMVPVTPEGKDDDSRAVIYNGSAQVMTPGGALPLSFDIPADNLADAVAQFATEAEKAVQDTMEELREMQRKAASSIVVPGSDPMGGMGGGMGGMGGGGKIQMP